MVDIIVYEQSDFCSFYLLVLVVVVVVKCLLF